MRWDAPKPFTPFGLADSLAWPPCRGEGGCRWWKTIVESLIFLKYVGLRKKSRWVPGSNIKHHSEGRKGNLANIPEIGASMSFCLFLNIIRAAIFGWRKDDRNTPVPIQPEQRFWATWSAQMGGDCKGLKDSKMPKKIQVFGLQNAADIYPPVN